MDPAMTARIGPVRPPSSARFIRGWSAGLAVLAQICALALCGGARAQSTPEIALKSGESAELQSVYYVAHCKSIMVAPPQVEVLEGPPELTLSIKEGEVLARRLNCPNKVAGGTLIATVKDVKEPIKAKLTFRVKYRTRDGDRQVAHTYSVSLFP